MNARREELKKRMQDYDTQVYFPALRELRARCATEGHTEQFTDFNVIGIPWYTCTKCGATRLDKQEDWEE
jgi:hypothetical protein